MKNNRIATDNKMANDRELTILMSDKKRGERENNRGRAATLLFCGMVKNHSMGQ
mgnify:CR=1 FL=1